MEQVNMFDISNPQVREQQGYTDGKETRPILSIHWEDEMRLQYCVRRSGMSLEEFAARGLALAGNALPLPLGYRIIIVNADDRECVELASNR
jgi:hypothetical protein